MRNIKKVLISTLSVMIVALIFGSATYAWITLSSINNIEGLSLTASAGDDLQLSLDGITYYNQLPGDLIYETIKDVNLKDVTSIDGVNFLTGGLRPKVDATPNEHYISFDLWFKTSRPEHNIYLINHIDSKSDYETDQIGTYVISKGVRWMTRYGFLNGPSTNDWVAVGSIDTYYASQAIRISFIELNDDFNSNDIRTSEDMQSFIFDPSNNPYRGYGTNFGAFSYFFQKTLYWIELPTYIPPVSYKLTQIDPEDPYQALSNDSLITVLQPTGLYDSKNNQYYSGKIKVNIWIEGWDADAFDAIDGDHIKFQFQFKAARPPMNG